MLEHQSITRIRVQKRIGRIGGMVYSQREHAKSIRVVGPTDRPSWAEARQLTDFRDGCAHLTSGGVGLRFSHQNNYVFKAVIL